MANDEHVALLKQGVAAWNTWRDENPDVSDLSEADLSGAHLQHAHLVDVDFTDADLTGCRI
jgi:uncharacterized protein YjbI with pentapeptide repeats